RDRMIFNMDEESWDSVVAVHLKGTFNMCRHAAPVMRERGYGRIINMTSAAGLKGNFGQTNYSAAKAGIVGLTLTLALELKKYGITVNAFAPRATTRMTGAIPGDRDPVKSRGPETDPEHNAPLVSFLASAEAAGVTGQIFGKGAPGANRYGFVIHSYSREIAEMVRDTPWTAAEVAERFGATLAPYLQERAVAK
ncbi:MAG: SDR family oxidoreductase, partial [Candidatus Binatia bacterium]